MDRNGLSHTIKLFCNLNLVENLPLTFESEEHYFASFVYPLLEETRADLASSMEIMYRAPFAEILSFNESKCGENMVYDVIAGPWKNQFSERGKDGYCTLPGDLLILVDRKPESISDLQHVGRTWALSLVKSNEDDSTSLKVKASKPIEFQEGMFVIFAMNITTQNRIWNSLHIHRNLDIIKEVLYSHSMVKRSCNICSTGYDSILSQYDPYLLVNLNESQRAAIIVALCKTTLVCALTDVAIIQLASRVLRLVRESCKITTASGDYFDPVGDVVLFGTNERLNVSTDIEEIFLEHRVKRLVEFLGPVTGWKHCIRSMVDLLENCVSKYHMFVKNELCKEKQQEVKSFIEFVRDRFNSSARPLRRCIVTFCTHIPRNFMGEYNFKNIISLLDNLSSLESLLFQENVVSEELQDLFTSEPMQDDMSTISFFRAVSLSVLTTLQQSLAELTLPSFLNKYAITQFCFERASAESIIPLQLPGLKHAILIGDEHQLPAVVNSNVCVESGFGRSLFDRLSSLGHSKHLLNVQYRMHPSISVFPNRMFYQNQIQDAPNVLSVSHEKTYLSVPMFGSYSFINVVGGREERDDNGRSQRNMVEVAVVVKIVQNLYKAWQDSKQTLTVGVISPYVAQAILIQEKLTHKYEKLDGFSVKVKSVDGFQGGEEDIVILSTVRSNGNGLVGFMSSHQMTNVALKRARKELVCDARNHHCLFDADADADECLKTTIIAVKKELDQLDDLVNGNSVLFKHAKWKVLFSDDFRRPFRKLIVQALRGVMNLEVPRSWPTSQKIIRIRYLSDCEDESEVSVKPNDARNYVENSRISESLLLMKFYLLSRGVVSHLLSDKEVDLPMQVTDEQMDIISSRKSLFINGRSGTGKTTVLTTKLFQHEQKFRIASDGIYEGESMVHRGIRSLIDFLRREKVTLSRSSAEAEYRGVANVVAETAWIRNLLLELHAPLTTATLVYCDNVSAVYLTTNPVQHQRTKHIEIDIHFVRDYVASGQVRVLHIPSRFQYADIFTKGLPSALFCDFRSSLNVRRSPVLTAGEY
ncbi:UvrD-like helicase, ATP-binding domain, P-loop containing nucleoside triphosphate hydrolase [Tanacetum coccineum]